MVKSVAIIFACLALGELIVSLTGVMFPGSIVGMLLLTFFLQVGLVKLSWVKGVADVLIKNIALFFVPPGVALMIYFDLIKAELLPITAATILSIIIVMLFTGWIHQMSRKLQRKISKKKRVRQ